MIITTVGEIKSSTVVNFFQKNVLYLFHQESQFCTSVFENHFGNSCLNGEKVVAYCERVVGVERRLAKGGTQGAKSLGAAGKGFSTTLQTGGHTLNNSTLKALGLTKEQGKFAIEALKKAEGLPNNFHPKIMGNGDYINAHTGEWIGNLFDYLY